MKTTYSGLCLVAMVCLAIILLALLQPVPGLVFLFLIPFWFFVALVFSIPLPVAPKVRAALSLLALPVFSPRPPPAR